MRHKWHPWGWPWTLQSCGKRHRPRWRRSRRSVWTCRVALLMASLPVLAWGVTSAWAQERLGIDPPPRLPGLVEPSFPDAPQPPPLPRPVLPPLPPLPPGERERLPEAHVFVRQIIITGSTVFSEAELAAVIEPYVNREATSEDLEALRLDLTRLYINAGYINSGALLPDQTVTAGVITYQIIEGDLTSVTLEGNRWFRESYFRKRLTLDVEPPLHIGALQARLQLLQQDDRIEHLHAELSPGVQLGESTLHVRVEERQPFFVALEFNNYQSPTVGAEQGLMTVAHRSLTGHGDILSFTYGRSSGLNPKIDASYTLPLTARETTIALRYRRNESSVVEAAFAPLDIDSQSEIFTLSLRQPLYRTLRRELALSLTGERLQSKTTFFGGEPFLFSPGTRDGKAVNTAVRLSAEWFDRTPNQVIAVRSRFSVGVDALGATINPGDDPDGQFFAWLGQFQWARRLPIRDIELLARLDLQLAADPLLPLEQVGVGGRYSVRGYRENQLVRDNALIASLESRLPLVRHRRWADYLQLVPFVDVGRGWSQHVTAPDPTTLVSLGLGLRWAATFGTTVALRPQVEVFWGHKLKDVQTTWGDLQDHGVHLQFVLAAF